MNSLRTSPPVSSSWSLLWKLSSSLSMDPTLSSSSSELSSLSMPSKKTWGISSSDEPSSSSDSGICLGFKLGTENSCNSNHSQELHWIQRVHLSEPYYVNVVTSCSPETEGPSIPISVSDSAWFGLSALNPGWLSFSVELLSSSDSDWWPSSWAFLNRFFFPVNQDHFT